MAGQYPNTAVPGRLRDFLSKVPQMGVPERATQKWLASAGYAGGNAMTILPVLRFVGIINREGQPTELWAALRRGDSSGRAQLGHAIHRAYADLFAMYPDAHRRESDALRSFFRAHTTGGDKVQSRTVQTFKALAEFADFDSVVAEGDESDSPGELVLLDDFTPEDPRARIITNDPRARSLARTASAARAFTLQLTLHLPESTDPKVYDHIFAAVSRHLLRDGHSSG